MAKALDLPESVYYLLSAAHKAPSADNSQPWCFIWDGKRLLLKFDEGRANRIFSLESHAIRLTMGAVLENLALAQHASGISARWTPTTQPEIFGDIEVDTDIKVPADAWSHPLFTRHTNRFPFKDSGLPSPVMDGLSSIREGEAGLRIFSGKGPIAQIAGLVKTASEMRFQMKELHEWLGESLRFTPEEAAKGDGLDVETLALPFGGRALLNLIKDWKRMEILNRLGGYRLLAAIEATNFKKAGAVISILGPRGKKHEIDAGRILERAWILINEAGLAVHPYYVVSDQLIRAGEKSIPSHLKSTTDRLLKKKKEIFGASSNVHMLLRVGYPSQQHVPSRRVPLEKIYKTDDAL
ncbi:MAG: hypothetical protein H6965_05805 [Chromatiaceae bacterium]|nr:hypothetical protein [Chromatiaceae bacterium]